MERRKPAELRSLKAVLISQGGWRGKEGPHGMRREKDEFLGEDGAPDYGGEDPDASLGDGRGSCCRVGSRDIFHTRADTYQSTSYGTEAAPPSGSHLPVYPTAVPPHSARAQRLRWTGYRLPKPCREAAKFSAVDHDGTSGWTRCPCRKRWKRRTTQAKMVMCI